MSIVPSRRALVVDDSREARLAAARLIEPYGFDVDLADDGASALRRLEERAGYDLVLVDLRMPHIDGHELVRIMRARALFSPVVIMTAGVDTRLVASTLKLGATDFLVKPLDAASVKQALARAMSIPPEVLGAETPRVLVAGGDDARAALASALPSYVEVDRVERADLDRAVQERPYRLAVVDARAPTPEGEAQAAAEASAAAARVLEVQPGAGLCCLAPSVGAVPGFDVSLPLDGLASAAEASLYPNTVRPLVLHDESAIVVSGFRATPETEATYFAVADRRLRVASALVAASGRREVTIDLSRTPARTAGVERLAASAARAMGDDPPQVRFLVAPALVSAVARLGLPARVEAPGRERGPRAIFRWTPDLAVGVASIDAMHQELFGRLSALLSYPGPDRGILAGETVQFLQRYALEHFAEEEALMTSAAYPRLEEHVAQHRRFAAQLEELTRDLQAVGYTPAIARRLEHEVCGWLYRHVQGADRALGQALAGRT